MIWCQFLKGPILVETAQRQELLVEYRNIQKMCFIQEQRSIYLSTPPKEDQRRNYLPEKLKVFYLSDDYAFFFFFTNSHYYMFRRIFFLSISITKCKLLSDTKRCCKLERIHAPKVNNFNNFLGSIHTKIDRVCMTLIMHAWSPDSGDSK